jgi:hypothetical protein
VCGKLYRGFESHSLRQYAQMCRELMSPNAVPSVSPILHLTVGNAPAPAVHLYGWEAATENSSFVGERLDGRQMALAATVNRIRGVLEREFAANIDMTDWQSRPTEQVRQLHL